MEFKLRQFKAKNQAFKCQRYWLYTDGYINNYSSAIIFLEMDICCGVPLDSAGRVR